MKKIFLGLFLCIVLLFTGCATEKNSEQETIKAEPVTQETDTQKPTASGGETNEDDKISVSKVEGLSEDFIFGADISSLLSLEASGRKFYGFDGTEQDVFKTLSEAGINYIRVRVWNNPFDENGNGYGGGNCTVETAIELGKRAAEYNMGLMVDFHYSDFWADPGKQQAPKAWENMSVDEKATAMYDFTVESLNAIKASGINVGMVQVGNETTGGLCGETEKENIYKLMKSAAKAVRDTDSSIIISVHYTNPEKKLYADFANDLLNYEVDYDVFATSYYPEYHGTIANLKEQLEAVHNISGKKVMIAETSWAYDSTVSGAYKRSVQGQADAIRDCVQAMTELGDYAIGVFYWEPAWIDVPGNTETEKNSLRETYGAGWASSFAGGYDLVDAGQYYGKTACIPTSLFDPDGYPLESLKTFLYVRAGKGESKTNYIKNSSFEGKDYSMWTITEKTSGTANFKENGSDARDGEKVLHFWSEEKVEFCVEQTVDGLPEGTYTFSAYVQGGDINPNSTLLVYVESDGTRYEQTFAVDGWLNWKNPTIENIKCSSSSILVGIEVNANSGAWGTIDLIELTK